MLTNKRTISVEFGECDPSGIVYNPNYFIWFDLSVHALLASVGLSLKTLIADFGIDGIPVVDYRCKFLGPARWGDELVIETSVTALHRCAFDIKHRILNGGTPVVDCAETRVCTAIDPQQGRAKAHPLPDKLVAAFSGKKI
jgi:4-hydroxybenzoyl-CoA thioesterase